MEEKKTDQALRREIVKTLAVTTLVFFAVLGGLLLLHRQLPALREKALVSALEEGRYDRARSLADKLGDGEKTREYLVQCDYREALSRMEGEDWEAAARLFLAATGYQDATEKKKECDYRAACALADAGRWEEAEERFFALGEYGDAAQRYDACRYERAAALAGSGALSDAAALYAALGDYRDAEAHLRSLAVALTGIEDEETAMNALQGLTPEMLIRMSELSAQRETLPRGVVDVGFYHTVGLAPDGGVLACGDNSYGQCELSGIRDAVAVAAGAYHSVVLHADGTVTACGRDSEGQCDTASWRNVVQIAAADYASFGLCADGSLLCVGYNDYDAPSGWQGLSLVRGGSYNVGALRQDGSARVYPALSGGDVLTGLVELSLNTGYAVGVRADGGVVATAFTLDGWTDILSVSASGTLVLGLRADGTVLCHAFRDRDALDLRSVTGAVAIAAGGTHSAVVLRDGSVRVFGEGDRGQADTEGWRLAVGG